MSTATISAVVILLGMGLCSCAHYQAKPISLRSTAQAYSQRTLDDTELQARLRALHLEQNGQGWNRAQLLVVASERNPVLRLARAQLATASAGVMTAQALANPTLSLGSEYNLSQTAESPWLWSLTTDWLLDAGLHRQLRMQLADAQLRAARLDYAQAVWATRSELRVALLGYFISAQRQMLLTQIVNDQDRLLTLQRQRVTQGELAANETLPVQLELARSRTALADSAARQIQALSLIAQALGMPMSAVQSRQFEWNDVLHVTELDDSHLDQLREQALLSRADLEHAVLDYQSRELELRQAVRQQYPQLSIGPGYTWDHGVKKLTLGLSVALPVFNQNQGPIAQAEAQRSAAGEQVVNVQAQILNDIAANLQSYRASVANLQSVMQQSDATEAMLQQARRSRELGAADQSTVLTAQLVSNTQLLSVLDAVEVMQQTLGKLEDALRTPLSGPELTLGKTVFTENPK